MDTVWITGLASLANSITTGFIVWRLRPAAAQSRYSIRSFRGSFFWFFLNTFLFSLVMSIALLFFGSPEMLEYAYVIGHFFFYVGLAIFVFAPASVVMPDRKRPPQILFLLILVSMIAVTIFNWQTYASGDYEVAVENNLAIFNPPQIVFVYIAVVAGICFLLLGAVIFFYHSVKTKNPFLKSRSRLIAIGFFIAGSTGPLNDRTWSSDIAPYAVAFATILSAIGFITIARGVLKSQESN